MDPTHFLAGQTLSRPPKTDKVQDFYETHSTDPFRTVRRVFGHLATLCKRPAHSNERGTEFAAAHPAE